ncbi:MAG: low temperature requirement protein A, partial [Pseudomonadota bacterium]
MTIRFGVHARRENDRHRPSTELELFFDLVIVTAVAALTATMHHSIVHGDILASLPEFLIAFVMIWWSWTNYTWFAAAFDNDDWLHRSLTIAMMAGIAIFAGGIEHIYSSQTIGFALVGWVIMRGALVVMWLRAAVGSPDLRTSALVFVVGLCAVQFAWVWVAFSGAETQTTFVYFLALVLAEMLIPVVAGRFGKIPFHQEHIKERYGLLTIIVLGEIV